MNPTSLEDSASARTVLRRKIQKTRTAQKKLGGRAQHLLYHSVMKTRIGLVTARLMGRSVTKFVEVADTAELAAALTKIGAKQAVLYWRDRIGDGHVEGKPFTIDKLTDKHFAWAADQTKDGMRGLFCEVDLVPGTRATRFRS